MHSLGHTPDDKMQLHRNLLWSSGWFHALDNKELGLMWQREQFDGSMAGDMLKYRVDIPQVGQLYRGKGI